jgi:hypothetical protein
VVVQQCCLLPQFDTPFDGFLTWEGSGPVAAGNPSAQHLLSLHPLTGPSLVSAVPRPPRRRQTRKVRTHSLTSSLTCATPQLLTGPLTF